MAFKINMLCPWRKHMKRLGLSETKGASEARLSRLTWRAVIQNKPSVELKSLLSVADSMDLEVTILAQEKTGRHDFSADFSTVATAYKVLRDGKNSWKIHYMNLVDEFRRTLDPRLLILSPPSELPLPLVALLASIVTTLCWEAECDVPTWAKRRYDLNEPWFVSETESLKAMSILESPLPFRRNNIFVGSNFLERV
jgi:hypothetical protein